MAVKYRIVVNPDGTAEVQDPSGKPVRNANWLIKAIGEVTEEKHKPQAVQQQESLEIKSS